MPKLGNCLFSAVFYPNFVTSSHCTWTISGYNWLMGGNFTGASGSDYLVTLQIIRQ